MRQLALGLTSLLCCCTSGAWAASVQWPSDSVIRHWALEKRGLGLFGPEKAQQVSKLKGATWAYDWRLGEDQAFVAACAARGVEYVPMIWDLAKLVNTSDGKIVDVYKTNQTFPNTTQYLLGFNEPNKMGQAVLSAELAAANWPLVEKAAKRFGLKLASPVPATCGHFDCALSDPFTWWDDFFGNCTANLNRTCHVDIMAAHFYTPCDVGALQKLVDEISWKYNKPIFLTEFGCWEGAQGSVRNTTTFLRRAISYLDSDPRVLKYAWFSPDAETELLTGPNALYYGAGNQTALTGLGKIYLDQLYDSGCSSVR